MYVECVFDVSVEEPDDLSDERIRNVLTMSKVMMLCILRLSRAMWQCCCFDSFSQRYDESIFQHVWVMTY